jgi:hypothetical protein
MFDTLPGCINLVGDGISRKDEGLPQIEGDGRSVIPDWEHMHGLQYNMLSVNVPSIVHSILRKCFIKEPIFIKAIDALLGITGTSMEREHSRAKHHAEGYFIEDGKLWCLGGTTPTNTVSHRECVTKLEAIQLAREEHAKVHMDCDHIRTQLLNKIYSPS